MFLKLLFTPGNCETELKSTHSGEECNSPAVAELWGSPMLSMDPHLEYIRVGNRGTLHQCSSCYISTVYVSWKAINARGSQGHSRTRKGTELLITLFVSTTY